MAQNSVGIELSSDAKIRSVFQVLHSRAPTYLRNDNEKPISGRPVPVTTVKSYKKATDKSLMRKVLVPGFQFLILRKDGPTHDTKWQPSEYCAVDNRAVKRF